MKIDRFMDQMLFSNLSLANVLNPLAEKNCSCAKQELPCTETCLCLRDDDCENECKDTEINKNGDEKSDSDSESSDDN